MTDQSNSAPARAALPVIEPTYTIEQVAQMANRSYASVNRDIRDKLLTVIQKRKNGRRAVRRVAHVMGCAVYNAERIIE